MVQGLAPIMLHTCEWTLTSCPHRTDSSVCILRPYARCGLATDRRWASPSGITPGNTHGALVRVMLGPGP